MGGRRAYDRRMRSRLRVFVAFPSTFLLVAVACGSAPTEDEPETASSSSGICAAFASTIKRCPDAYCFSEFDEEPRELAVCNAFVAGVLASDSAANQASCDAAVAGCSAEEQAKLRQCSECISTLGCGTTDLTDALHTVSQVRLPSSDGAPCAAVCKTFTDTASEVCVEAIDQARRGWVEAMLRPGCEDLGGIAQGTSCDFQLACQLTCRCTNTVAIGADNLTVECLTVPLCTYPETFDTCSRRCGSVEAYEGFSVACPAPPTG